MTTIKIFIILSVLCIAVSIDGCNSNTPVEYTNTHDPLSEKYIHPITMPPFNLRLTTSSNSGITISWQDTNQYFYTRRNQNWFVLERSNNNGQFTDLARLSGSTFSYADNEVDTSIEYRYRIRTITQYDTSFYTSILKVQYTVVDAQIISTLNLYHPVSSLTLSPDGTMLAATGASGAIKVWSLYYVKSWDFSYEGTGSFYNEQPNYASFSLDNKMITAIGDGLHFNTLNVCRLSDGNTIDRISGSQVMSWCFSPDGSKIILGEDWRGNLEVWDIASCSLDTTIGVCSSGYKVDLLYLTRDGKSIIVGGEGIQIHRSTDLSEINRFPQSNCLPDYYAISLDEKYISCNGTTMSLQDGSILCSLSDFSSLSIPYGYNASTALSYDDRFLVGQSESGLLFVGQVSNKSIRVMKSIPLPESTLPSVLCLPNSYKFFTADSVSGRIDQWALIKGWTDN